MFELIVTLCLAAQTETCRDVLLPGHEAATRAACEAGLSERLEGAVSRFPGLLAKGTARCVPLGAVAEVHEAADGIFVFHGQVAEPAADNVGAVSNAGFVIGANSVAVIDTGGSRVIGERLYRAIRAQTDLPISHVILTHMHPDHVFGVSVFEEVGARIVGHVKLATALMDRRESYRTAFERVIGDAPFIGSKIVLPEVEVADRSVIDLGGRELELMAWPTAHSTNDLTVLDRETGVMFTGDLVFNDHAPALDGSVRGWVSVLDRMQGQRVAQIVPGHGGPVLPWPEGGADLSRYLSVLIADTRRALDLGAALSIAVDTIATSEAGRWQLFEQFNARNATVAYTELEWE